MYIEPFTAKMLLSFGFGFIIGVMIQASLKSD